MTVTRPQVLRAVLVIGVALAAGSAGYLAQRSRPAPPPEANIPNNAGGALLALTLPDASGQPQAVAQWKGRVIVMNFWATWCPPCLREIPDFADASRALRDLPVQFVGVGIDRAENVARFAQEKAVPYPLLVGTPETLTHTASLGNAAQALPFTAIFAPDGSLAFVRLGTLKRDELEGKIRAVLAAK